MPTQLLIDGHSLLFRAYHALPPLTTKNGIPTGAIYGFTAMLLKVVDQERPDRLVVVFDAPEETFRHQQYQEYKAGRAETPDDFRQQMPFLRQLLDNLGVPVITTPGFEADDALGTLAKLGEERGYESLIVTGDRDLLQLVRPGVMVLLTQRSGITDIDRLDRDGVKDKMGVWPEQVPDLKGLMGDSSDNIPGIAGIGKKSALSLIETYGSIDHLLDNLEELQNTRWVRALLGHEADARRYRDLATIVQDVPIEWPEIQEPFQWRPTDALGGLLAELELTQVQKRLGLESLPQADTSERLLPPVTRVDAIDWQPHRLYAIYEDHEGFWVYDEALQQVARCQDVSIIPATVGLVGWGIKSYWRQQFALSQPLAPFVADVKLEAYLLDSERRDYEVMDLLHARGVRVDTEQPHELAVAIGWLSKVQQEDLARHGMHKLYQEVELPLAKVLAHMEARGVLVDREQLLALGEELARSIEKVEHAIYELGGGEFNINSGRQLSQVLFDKLGLPVLKKTKTGVSTDAETLETLRPLHPIVEHILEYRQLVKLQGTYVEGLLPLIQTDGRIHTTFHQTVTATGRLSSSDPNLQNIPVRVPLGRRVRGVFVPSPGQELLAADYSQIELRMLAHMAGDDNLIQAFVDGEDIHRRTASEIFNLPLDAVDATWRSRAKAVNFGIIYGISDFGLARDTGVSRTEAHDYIDRYYQRYPALKEYFERVIAESRDKGYVSTILGRRRFLPDIRSKNHVRRQYSERMAMNTAIQGSAADLIKVAMVNIDEATVRQALHSGLILQVHDELIWDALPEEVFALKALAEHYMTTALDVTVPLVVEFKVGNNWEKMQPWSEAHQGA